MRVDRLERTRPSGPQATTKTAPLPRTISTVSAAYLSLDATPLPVGLHGVSDGLRLDAISCAHYTRAMWEVLGTEEFAGWYRELTDAQAGAIDARVELLEQHGPALGRPVVDSIKGSRHRNMKELRCSKDGALRVLLVFDPLRRAVLLLGGDKSEGSAWSAWYRRAIPHADDLYDQYLTENEK